MLSTANVTEPTNSVLQTAPTTPASGTLRVPVCHRPIETSPPSSVRQAQPSRWTTSSGAASATVSGETIQKSVGVSRGGRPSSRAIVMSQTR